MQDLYKYKAHVNRVIDGDTIQVTLDAGFQLSTEIRLRLNGVDTPERNELNWKEATAFTTQRLQNQDIIVQTYKSDVFGRYLADVWYQNNGNWTHFNTELRFSGLVKTNSKWNGEG